MPKHKSYIPSPQHWKEMYAQHRGYWSPVDKVPLRKIKIDRQLFAYPNEVDPDQVNYIATNFDQEVWIPILINEDYFLLDGQHRLKVAKLFKLKYIDVIVQHQMQ